MPEVRKAEKIGSRAITRGYLGLIKQELPLLMREWERERRGLQ